MKHKTLLLKAVEAIAEHEGEEAAWRFLDNLAARLDNMGVRVCPECSGRGRVADEHGDFDLCPRCGGSGVEQDDDDERTLQTRQ